MHGDSLYMITKNYGCLCRTPATDSKTNEQLSHQSSQLSGNGRISPGTVLGSPEYITDSGDVDEFQSGIEGTEWDGHFALSDTMASVNNNDTLKPNTQHEIVNNIKEHLNMEAQLMYVNSDRRPENEESF